MPYAQPADYSTYTSHARNPYCPLPSKEPTKKKISPGAEAEDHQNTKRKWKCATRFSNPPQSSHHHPPALKLTTGMPNHALTLKLATWLEKLKSQPFEWGWNTLLAPTHRDRRAVRAESGGRCGRCGVAWSRWEPCFAFEIHLVCDRVKWFFLERKHEADAGNGRWSNEASKFRSDPQLDGTDRGNLRACFSRCAILVSVEHRGSTIGCAEWERSSTLAFMHGEKRTTWIMEMENEMDGLLLIEDYLICKKKTKGVWNRKQNV